jgi:hypothetical protein
MFHTDILDMSMVYRHVEFSMPVSNNSLVITINWEAIATEFNGPP